MNTAIKGCFLKGTGDPVCVRCAVNFPLWTLVHIHVDDDEAWRLNGKQCVRCGYAFEKSPEPTYTPSEQELARFRFYRWMVKTGQIKTGVNEA